MPEPILAGYTYDPRVHAYRNLATGRTVARTKILDILDGQINERAARLGRLTLDYAENRLTPTQWIETMRNELRRAAIQNLALGSGGFDKILPSGYSRVGGILAADYRRLIAFADDIASGKLSDAQILNRLQMYLGNTRRNFFAAEREVRRSKPGMTTIEVRRLQPAEHCPECLILANKWRPAGVLPLPGAPGSSSCLTNCRCIMEAKEVPIAEVEQYMGRG